MRSSSPVASSATSRRQQDEIAIGLFETAEHVSVADVAPHAALGRRARLRAPHNFRRLRIRYERDPTIHTAFLTLACSILCWRRLKSL